MIKKIITLVLCAAVLMSVPAFAFSDVAADNAYKEAIDNLSSLGVLSGYPDGSFGAKDPLTRAQFAKIVVAMTGNSDAAESKKTEVFTDVSSGHWAIGYINEAAELGIITGYPDGSFAPEENINYAQAITVVIRMLGYSTDEVGTNWPFDYVNKASELGITKGLHFTNSEILTREVAAYILNNSLSAKEGSGNVVSGLKKVEDIIIYGTNKNNSGIAIDEVLTTGGTFKKGKVDIDKYLGRKVTVKVNSDNEITMVTKDSSSAREYTLTGAYNDKILTSEAGYLSIEGDTAAYYKGAKGTYGAIYKTLLAGSRVYMYDDYMYIEENKLSGPYTITRDYTQVNDYFGTLTSPIVTIDGEAAELNEIERYDVVYYNSATNRLYAYSERVTGIYEKATPSKDNLTSITLSGTVYENFSPAAKAKLDDTVGSYKIDDRITLLFGNDGSVVDVVDIDGKTLSDMGVILSAYTEVSKDKDTLGKNENYVKIMLATGKEASFKTDKDYSDTDNAQYSGKFVYINYKGNDTVSLEMAEENGIEGEFDKSAPSFAGYDFRPTYSILERVYSEKYSAAVVRKVNLSDVSVSRLNKSQVLHVEYANKMKDIAVLYVENVTYNGYTFGILNKAETNDEAYYSYEIKSSSGTSSYSGSAGWSFARGEAVMAMIEGGKIRTIRSLAEADSSDEIEDYTDNKIMMNGKVYKMDENVTVVYKKISKSDWNVTTLDDLDDNVSDGTWKVNTITLYKDDSGADAKVRVIKVTLK